LNPSDETLQNKGSAESGPSRRSTFVATSDFDADFIPDSELAKVVEKWSSLGAKDRARIVAIIHASEA